MSGLSRLFRGNLLTTERTFSIAGVGLAAFTFFFFLGGLRQLGRLAQGPAQFEFGLLVLLIGVFVLLCGGMLLWVLQRLYRRPQA